MKLVAKGCCLKERPCKRKVQVLGERGYGKFLQEMTRNRRSEGPKLGYTEENTIARNEKQAR